MQKVISSVFSLSISKFILFSVSCWLIFLSLIAKFADAVLYERFGYFSFFPWENFDGLHYTSIAKIGYLQYEQAFFPVYPLLIHVISQIIPLPEAYIGRGISVVCFVLFLFVMTKLIDTISSIPKKKKEYIKKQSVIFTMLFPTSFYFASVYTESLFLMLTALSFYWLSTRRLSKFAMAAAIASGVRITGAFLLVPVGLFGYMWFLKQYYGDPLMFLSVQPMFGANRTAGQIILLPQVLFRYAKIIVTVPWSNYDFWIAVLELVMFTGAVALLWIAWKNKVNRLWLLFSLAVIILPTLTGTLSSMPRYVLSAFPIFIAPVFLSRVHKFFLLVVYLIGTILLTTLFTQGYWVA